MRDELLAVEDELSDWARTRSEGFSLPPDTSLMHALGEVREWVTSQNYAHSAVGTFLQVADYYVVAQALAGGYTVVTHEVTSASLCRVKIPDACTGLGIKCVTPFEMLRLERAKFVLELT